MKKIIVMILIATNCFGVVLDSADVLFLKQMLFQLDTAINSKGGYDFLGIFGIGIESRYNLLAKFGYVADVENNQTLYVGLENKILIAQFFGGTDNVSLNLGGHMQQQKIENKSEFKPGCDITINSSNKFSIFYFFTGFDGNIEFYKKTKYPVNFFMGTKIELTKLNLVFEIDIPVTNDARYIFATSAMFIL